jgi:hypothetical protein
MLRIQCCLYDDSVSTYSGILQSVEVHSKLIVERVAILSEPTIFSTYPDFIPDFWVTSQKYEKKQRSSGCSCNMGLREGDTK